MTDPALRVTYTVRAAPDAVAGRAEALLLEQTVELPRRALRGRAGAERVLGRVERIEPAGEDAYRVTLAQPLAATALDPAQLLNLLFGNSSLQPDVVLEDVELPEALRPALPGPRAGLSGWRELTGVAGRPLLATALKPMGLPPGELAELAATFARAGLDVVKDDHGLADHAFCPFEARVTACLEALDRAARETGRRTLYLPNLIGTPERVRAQLSFARRAGARAVMMSPMLLGLPFLAQLAGDPEGLPVLAHPALAGTGRIAEVLLLGKLFRWYGADGVIFPQAGGRFRFTRETCLGIAQALRSPAAGLRPALPVPAGGIRVERAAELVALYGNDCMLLIGGSLYEAGSELGRRARELVESIARAAREGAAA